MNPFIHMFLIYYRFSFIRITFLIVIAFVSDKQPIKQFLIWYPGLCYINTYIAENILICFVISVPLECEEKISEIKHKYWYEGQLLKKK